MKELKYALSIMFTLGLCFTTEAQDRVSTPEYIHDVATRVNDYQYTHPWREKDNNWIRGTYYTGVMACYQSMRDSSFLNQCVAFGESEAWKIPSVKAKNYSSGANVLTCSQTWMECYMELGDEKMFTPTFNDVQNFRFCNPVGNTLEWYIESEKYVDAIFTAPPALAMMYHISKDERFLNWMDAAFWDLYGTLYDRDENLFYRDIRYMAGCDNKRSPSRIRPESVKYEDSRESYLVQQTPNGKKVIWSRGNGWAIAGIARMLKYMPDDYPNYMRYRDVYINMAKAIKACQREDGFWSVNLADLDDFGGPETSGTGLFTYALAWGINNGIISADEYGPVVERAWRALVSAVSAEGRVQYGQGVGESPYKVLKEDSHEYVSGIFLLAASEMYTLKTPHVTYCRFVPERDDDFAWENDLVAFRVYGPTAQEKKLRGDGAGTLSSGVDCWLKRVDYPIINRWYLKGRYGGSYHNDNGEGCDSYHVGVSRGCGGTALLYKGEYLVSNNFESYEIIKQSGDESQFRLYYAPIMVGGHEVREVRTVTIKSGDMFYRCDVEYQSDLKLKSMLVGITLHDKKGVVESSKAGWTTHWEPIQDSEVGTAVWVDSRDSRGSYIQDDQPADLNHTWLSVSLDHNKATYYAGFTWKKAGHHASMEEWIEYVAEQQRKVTDAN